MWPPVDRVSDDAHQDDHEDVAELARSIVGEELIALAETGTSRRPGTFLREFLIANGKVAMRKVVEAAEAAGFQGKFWEMHDMLYQEQAFWSYVPNARELFESYAEKIGLNLDQFKKDIDSEKVRERVDSDRALGDFLGVKLTPTLFINHQPVEPKDKTPEGVRAAINAALAPKSKSGT